MFRCVICQQRRMHYTGHSITNRLLLWFPYVWEIVFLIHDFHLHFRWKVVLWFISTLFPSDLLYSHSVHRKLAVRKFNGWLRQHSVPSCNWKLSSDCLGAWRGLLNCRFGLLITRIYPPICCVYCLRKVVWRIELYSANGSRIATVLLRLCLINFMVRGLENDRCSFGQETTRFMQIDLFIRPTVFTGVRLVTVFWVSLVESPYTIFLLRLISVLFLELRLGVLNGILPWALL